MTYQIFLRSKMAFSSKLQAIFIVSLIGVLDTLYLTKSFFSKDGVICLIDQGCDVVTTSIYSSWGGVPVALLGLAFYLFAALVSALLYYGKAPKVSLLFLKTAVSIALAVSLWFTYLQLFALNAICEYCILSAFLSLALFILTWFKARGVVKSEAL